MAIPDDLQEIKKIQMRLSKKNAFILFVLLVSISMSAVMSFGIIALRLSFVEDFLSIWLADFLVVQPCYSNIFYTSSFIEKVDRQFIKIASKEITSGRQIKFAFGIVQHNTALKQIRSRKTVK